MVQVTTAIPHTTYLTAHLPANQAINPAAFSTVSPASSPLLVVQSYLVQLGHGHLGRHVLGAPVHRLLQQGEDLADVIGWTSHCLVATQHSAAAATVASLHVISDYVANFCGNIMCRYIRHVGEHYALQFAASVLSKVRLQFVYCRW